MAPEPWTGMVFVVTVFLTTFRSKVVVVTVVVRFVFAGPCNFLETTVVVCFMSNIAWGINFVATISIGILCYLRAF